MSMLAVNFLQKACEDACFWKDIDPTVQIDGFRNGTLRLLVACRVTPLVVRPGRFQLGLLVPVRSSPHSIPMVMCLSPARVLQAMCLMLTVGLPAASAQTSFKRWILAEGAANIFFDEDIVIGNPNATEANVTITLLPEGAPATTLPPITVPPSARHTLHVNDLQDLSSGSLGAIVESNVDVVVERSMRWPNGLHRGGHVSQGVLAPAATWYLAEGVNGFFQTFVLIANTSDTQAAEVTAKFLLEGGGSANQNYIIPPRGRKTIYVNAEFPQFAVPYSTVIMQTNGSDLVVERAMYWNDYEGGHGSGGVAAPSSTWLFAEGTTGANQSFDFQTYLLLANPSPNAVDVTMTFFRDAGGPVQYTLSGADALAANSRRTLWLDELVFANGVKELASASFSIKVESSQQPILAERAMYWSSSGIVFVEGHNTVGVTAEATKWAFAEGREGRVDSSGLSHDSFFLISNANPAPLQLKATFVREDGKGLVIDRTIPAQQRGTISTSDFLELSHQRFSAFIESVNTTPLPFVAERAVYWGNGYFGGHAATGTPWTGAIAAPPPIDLTPTFVAMSPTQGPVSGGTEVTITGTNFAETTLVEFGGKPALSIARLSPTTVIATTPATAQPGPVTVAVINPGKPAATLTNGFSYVPVQPFLLTDFALGFGDSITFGVTSQWCDVGGTQVVCTGTTTGYPQRLAAKLQARYSAQTIQLQRSGVPGECASAECVDGSNLTGQERLAQTLTPAHDLLILLEGVNDLNAGQPIGTIANALRQMVQSAKNAGKKVVLCTLVPHKPHEQSGMPRVDHNRWLSLNAAIQQIAASEGIVLVNMAAAFGTDPNSLISPDGMHPNNAGYERMAQALFDHIVAHFDYGTASSSLTQP
jgi:lysophospholipase L1-like esterase